MSRTGWGELNLRCPQQPHAYVKGISPVSTIHVEGLCVNRIFAHLALFHMVRVSSFFILWSFIALGLGIDSFAVEDLV